MRVTVRHGAAQSELDFKPGQCVEPRGGVLQPPVRDIGCEVGTALEAPLAFPALRRAIVPGDHVAVVTDSDVPHAGEILGALVEYLADAGVSLKDILVIESSLSRSALVSNLLDQVPPGVRHMRHDPNDRSHLAYLASTRAGARVYLNREVVDADLVLLVGRVAYDPILGYRGTSSGIFPGLADEAARGQFRGRIMLDGTDTEQLAARESTDEVAWLLGVQFAVQVVVGADGEIMAVLAGRSPEVQQKAQGILESCWRRTAPERAELVIAAISDPPDQQGFDQLGAVLESALRLVKEGGAIVVLSSIRANPGDSLRSARKFQDLAKSLQHVRRHPAEDSISTWQIARACQSARVYLLSGLEEQLVEDLSMTPIASISEVQRLIDQAPSCIVIKDAQCVHVTVEDEHAKPTGIGAH